MAYVQFLVIVFLYINQVFAKSGCNDCVRQGGHWCKELSHQSNRCSLSQLDDTCSEETEVLPLIEAVEKEGLFFNPVSYERTINVGVSGAFSSKSITFKYIPVKSAGPPKIKIQVNATQKGFTASHGKVECKNSKCTTTIKATVDPEFCTPNSLPHEYAHVAIAVESINETAFIKYHVPCACECTSKVQINSTTCHNHGDLECGACLCYSGWTGQFCNELNCSKPRGDMPSCSGASVTCNGNGYCNMCEACVCYTDREGSQYFDESNDCKDLCMVTSECDNCLRNGSIGFCPDCDHHITIKKYNESLTATRDGQGRKEWVSCNVTVDECSVKYVAMKTDRIDIMIVESCEVAIAIKQQSSVEAPMILGILFLVAIVAAAAGFMLWKHLNAVPPLPLNDGGYSNIDAQDCVGVNPLYKSPTSSFKNPTYGKW